CMEGIWKLSLPNKIKIFIWRAYHEALPLKSNLVRRGINVKPLCPVYEICDETAQHLFLEFECAKEIWLLSGLSWWQQQHVFSSFANWVEFMRRNTDMSEMGRAMTIVWQTWFNRNQTVFTNKKMTPAQVLTFCKSYIAEYEATTNRAECER
ncbi:zf-RVT domain-containing protein, partial [Cephalotus follicularis]